MSLNWEGKPQTTEPSYCIDCYKPIDAPRVWLISIRGKARRPLSLFTSREHLVKFDSGFEARKFAEALQANGIPYTLTEPVTQCETCRAIETEAEDRLT